MGARHHVGNLVLNNGESGLVRSFCVIPQRHNIIVIRMQIQEIVELFLKWQILKNTNKKIGQFVRSFSVIKINKLEDGECGSYAALCFLQSHNIIVKHMSSRNVGFVPKVENLCANKAK